LQNSEKLAISLYLRALKPMAGDHPRGPDGGLQPKNLSLIKEFAELGEIIIEFQGNSIDI